VLKKAKLLTAEIAAVVSQHPADVIASEQIRPGPDSGAVSGLSAAPGQGVEGDCDKGRDRSTQVEFRRRQADYIRSSRIYTYEEWHTDGGLPFVDLGIHEPHF
jgi:hypothetical protein